MRQQNGCVIAFGSGFGLAAGGGLAYMLIISEAGRLLFLALGMFILGVIVIGSALMWQNRQWMKAVFNNPNQVTHQYKMPPYPPYPMAGPQQPMLPPGGDPYQWPMIVDNQQANNALHDDSPMA